MRSNPKRGSCSFDRSTDACKHGSRKVAYPSHARGDKRLEKQRGGKKSIRPCRDLAAISATFWLGKVRPPPHLLIFPKLEEPIAIPPSSNASCRNPPPSPIHQPWCYTNATKAFCIRTNPRPPRWPGRPGLICWDSFKTRTSDLYLTWRSVSRDRPRMRRSSGPIELGLGGMWE